MRGGGSDALTESVLMFLRLMAQHRLIARRAARGGGGGGGGGADGAGKPPADEKKRPIADGADGSDAGAAGEGEGELTGAVVELLDGALTRFYTQKNVGSHEARERGPEASTALGWRLAPTIDKHVSGARDSFLCGEAYARRAPAATARGVRRAGRALAAAAASRS